MQGSDGTETGSTPTEAAHHAADASLDDLRQQLGSEFEVLRRLGGGSNSTVYLAREPALRRLVAIKVLHRPAAMHPKRLARFRREARALAQVSHPSVVSIFRVGDLASEAPYLIMQYVRGTDLAERLRSEGPLTPESGCRVLATIADALRSVHSHGIVHRDVRPESILWELDSGHVMLSDFGLAAYLEEDAEEGSTRLTTAGHVVTDLRFTSPETLGGHDPTGASDIYSLGVLGYHLVAGRGPYKAPSKAAHARAHLDQDPLPFRALGVEVPGELEAVLKSCLAKRPDERPPAGELAHTLGSLRSDSADDRQGEVPVAPTPGLDSSPADLTMQMLGGLDLRSADGSLGAILRQPKRVALLAYLATAPNKLMRRREELIGLFWPDAEPDSARHSLRQALYVLRRELGSGVLLTRGDEEVGLDDRSLESDVARFEELSRSGQPSRAFDVYAGDFLPGFFLDGAPEFERWLAVERLRLRRMAAAAAWEASRLATQRGEGAAASHLARAAVELDPFDEKALYRLIELLDGLGDRAGALAAFDHFETRLANEYSAEPSPETRRLVARVRSRG